jgi:hypothetical protein
MNKILMNHRVLRMSRRSLLLVQVTKIAKKAMKEEIKTLRERIMDEVEKGLKKEDIEMNLPD